jgi:hypothetical protein
VEIPITLKGELKGEKRMRNNLALDDTLWHLYIAIRNNGATLLAIRFTHRGKKWEADTADEALRLRKTLEEWDALEPGAAVLAEQQMRAETVWTPDTFWNFIQVIKPQQKSAVMALVENQSIWAPELAKAIGIHESALGGVLSGLSKQLKHLSLRPSHLYQVETDWSDNQRRRLFHLQPAFRLTAEELGWPEERRQDAASTKAKRKH